MKLRVKDKVMVITGKYKGKTGEVIKVLPRENSVVVEGINIVKRHTKPTNQNPKGGIVEQTKPIGTSKVMVLDPKTNKPARVGYAVSKAGKKERVFKVSKFKNIKKPTTKAKVGAKK